MAWFKTSTASSRLFLNNRGSDIQYHPPGAEEKSIREHLFQSLTLAESRYSNCGLLITGDFNRLNINGLLNHFRLKQIVKASTREMQF
jgi:hypothetical protein